MKLSQKLVAKLRKIYKKNKNFLIISLFLFMISVLSLVAVIESTYKKIPIGLVPIILNLTILFYLLKAKIINLEEIRKKHIKKISIAIFSLITIFLLYIMISNIAFINNLTYTKVYAKPGYEHPARYFYSLNPELYHHIKQVNLYDNPIELKFTNYIAKKFDNFETRGVASYHTLTLYALSNSSSYDFLIAHELCHFVYQFDFNEEEKERWSVEYNKAEFFYRDYSKTNIDEDFADICSLYIINNIPFYNKLVEQKDYAYMEKFYQNSDVILFYNELMDKKLILDDHFNRRNITSLYI